MFFRARFVALEFGRLHPLSKVATAMIPRTGLPAEMFYVPEHILNVARNHQGQILLIMSFHNLQDDSVARRGNGSVVMPVGSVAIYYRYRGQDYDYSVLR